MWELDHKEGWALKNRFFETVVLEKTFENPLNFKEIKLVNPTGNQSWIFIGRTDAKDEAPILWPPYVESQLTGKDPDAGKDWRQKEKGATGWDGWITSLSQWTWVWAKSGRYCRTGKLGVLQSMDHQELDVTQRLDSKQKFHTTILSGLYKHEIWKLFQLFTSYSTAFCKIIFVFSM